MTFNGGVGKRNEVGRVEMEWISSEALLLGNNGCG